MAARVDAASAKTVASRETRAAIKYLTATGSTAISILERDGACQIRVGHKIDPDAHSMHWLQEPNAIAVSRKEAGSRPDVATMINALCDAAAYWNETLTPHDLALQRAADAIKRLDAMMEALRASEQLNIFDQNYHANREAAASVGIGFMPYEVARSRLRMALVPYVTEGKRLEDVTELFPKSSARPNSPTIGTLLDQRRYDLSTIRNNSCVSSQARLRWVTVVSGSDEPMGDLLLTKPRPGDLQMVLNAC